LTKKFDVKFYYSDDVVNEIQLRSKECLIQDNVCIIAKRVEVVHGFNNKEAKFRKWREY